MNLRDRLKAAAPFLPLTVDPLYGSMLWGPAFKDCGPLHAVDVRGWGALHTRLGNEAAMKAQDALAALIAHLCNNAERLLAIEEAAGKLLRICEIDEPMVDGCHEAMAALKSALAQGGR